MRIRTVSMAILLLVGVGVEAGGRAPSPPGEAAAAFDRLKTLVGEWESEGAKDKARLSYELVAGGTALMERETAEKRPMMVTLYHLDGDHLLLTHYCMAGNQPRMQARPFDAKTGELSFEFLDATNLASPSAGHMRSVAIRFVDRNHIDSTWRFYEGGKPTFTETARYTRVK